MEAWASSGQVSRLGVCHVPLPSKSKYTVFWFVLETHVLQWVWTSSGNLSSSTTYVCACVCVCVCVCVCACVCVSPLPHNTSPTGEEADAWQYQQAITHATLTGIMSYRVMQNKRPLYFPLCWHRAFISKHQTQVLAPCVQHHGEGPSRGCPHLPFRSPALQPLVLNIVGLPTHYHF